MDRLFGRQLGPFMMTWWLVLMSRSRRDSDSATTGAVKRGYQSLGALLLVMISDRPCHSETSP